LLKVEELVQFITKKEKSNISPSTTYHFFNSTVTTITLDTLEKVCQALEYDPRDIFFWTNKPSSIKKKTQSKVIGKSP
jgi:DNA-binding Xre family transcriptional regulator